MAERPLYTLYKNLKAQNFDVPDDYNKFESALTRDGKSGADNRHAIYENLKAQNFDVPSTYERFYSALFEPRSKTSSRAKGGSVPMSAADRARYLSVTQSVLNTDRQVKRASGNISKTVERAKKFSSNDGKVTIGFKNPLQNKNVQKNKFNYNSTTGKTGTYTTTDGVEFDNEYDAAQYQNQLDKQGQQYINAVNAGEIPSVFDVRDKNGNYDLQENIGKNGTYLTEEGARKQFDKKLADAYARKKEIEAAIAEDHRLHGNPLLSYGASIGASNGRTAEQSDYSNKLATSLALVKQQIGALEAVKQYPTSSWGEDALKALDNTAFTAKTWDFGLTDFATMGQMERIKTKMDNKIPLSGSDKILLKSKLGADAAAALEDEKMGNIYRWTKIAGQSLPFMADFFLTGGYGGITKGISRGALKFAAKRGMGKVSAAILKNTGIVAGDVIGSYAMAGTEQALKTGADIMQRHLGNLYQDENGDYKFGTFDENGNLLHEGGESMGTALYKGLTSAMVENYTEKLFGHNYGIKKGAVNFMEKHGMNASAEFFKNIGKSGWYTNSKKWMEKFGINGFGEEVMEEEIGIPLHALLDDEGKVSDLLDAKQQLDIIGGMAISVGSMYAIGAGSRPVKGIYNRAQYYRFRNNVNVADSDAQNLIGDNWADIKDKIDNATNEQMGSVLADVLRQRDTMTKEQINAAVNYGVNLMKMRGYNIAKTAEMNAKEIANEPTTPDEQHQADIDKAYSEGHDSDNADKHDIQIQHEDQAKALAAALNISEQQLSGMSDEELESLTGQDDKLDKAIYDYQLSTARYQGVVDDAQDKVDLAAHQAEQKVNMYTDQSRGSVRNATIKASGGSEDYGVYIISGNIATHDDGSIDVSNSDDMILYYDPTTNSVEHADALMFAELGEELPADDVKAQAVADAKENAIKEVAGIIDGTVEVGSQFSVTDSDGTEHTYEVLADNGDGTAMITIDGNVPTELVKGENVQIPYSFADLQQMKDLEDQKRLEAAKAEREQMEKERDAQQTEQTKPSFDFNQILNDDGNVVLVDVLDDDGNTKYPDSKLFLIRDTGAKAKVVELKSDGTIVPHAVNKEDVATISSMSLDEYKQAMPSSMIEDNSGENRGEIEAEPTKIEDETTPEVAENTENTTPVDETAETHETEQTPAITLEDGTIVPMLDDGNPDFSKLTASQTAELYDTEFGEDAYSIVSGYVSDAKKALDKANNMTVKGKNFVEQKASKDAKEKAIADAQAAYDSAIAIRDAYNERQLAKVEDTAEGRKNLIEKARRKFARLKSSVKDDAEAVAQIYKETVGSLLHRLYDSTGIDVTDTIPLTAEEYVASNLGAHSLNYEGTETSKSVKQETGLSREDFAKTQLLAADGKGTTIDALVHSLWENRPSNLDSLDTQDIRNALIGVLTSGFKASEARSYVENIRIAQAEKLIEEERTAAENAAYYEQQKAKEEEEKEKAELEKKAEEEKSDEKLNNESSNESNDLSNESDNEKKNDNINDNINSLTPEQHKAKEDGEKLGFPAVDKEGEPINQYVIELANWAKEQGLEIDPTSKWNNYADLFIMCKDGFGVGTLVPDRGDSINQVVYFPDNVQGFDQLWKLHEEFNVGRDLKHSADMDNEQTQGVMFYDGDTAREFKEFVDKKVEEQNKVFGEQIPEEDLPFSAKENGTHQTTAERAADVEKNKVDDMKVVDNIVGNKTRKAFDRLAKMMGANIQWQYSDKLGNGWIQETTDADGNVHRTIFITLDSSITEGVQFIFGHEMTHQIKNLNPAAYNELTQLVLDTYGSDAFDKSVDETMKRYSYAGFSGRNRDYYAEEVVADAVGEMIRDLNLAHTLAMKMSHPLLAAIHEILQKIKLAFFGTEYSDVTKNIIRSIEQAYVKTANREAIDAATQEGEGGQRLSLRTKSEPKKTQKVYKLMRLGEDGKLYPLFIGSGEAIELGKWYDADSPKLQDLTSLSSKDYVGTRTAKKDGASVKEEYHYGAYIVNNKTGEAMSLADFKAKYSKQFDRMGNNPNKKAVDWATDNGYRWIKIEEKNQGQSRYGGEARSYYNYGINGSGSVSIFAMRPGWHAGSLPTMRQIGKGSAKNLRDDTFVWVEGEIPADIDYNEEAQKNADKDIPDHIPTDGYYLKATNANKEASQADKVGWFVAGAFRANRIMSDKETRDIIDEWNAAHPDDNVEYDWKRESGKDFNAETMSLEDTPKFSLKVYHGSGADFTEFDFDHMGEGAGSQVFGWGGYVTSSKKIGKDYAAVGQQSAESRHAYSEDTPIEAAVGSILGQDMYNHQAKTFEQKKAQAIKNAENSISSYSDMLKNSNELDEKSKKFLEKSIERDKKELEVLRTLTEEKYKDEYIKQGRAKNLYEVDIPDDNGSNYLDFENPMNEEQINAIHDALIKKGVDVSSWEKRGFKLDLPFKDVYAAVLPMMMRCEPKEVSKFLSSLGFTGIKYPAGTIQGGAEEDDTNYVIFNPKDMKITNHTKFSLRLKSAIEETETNPSDAQKESGNYKKGHIKFGGYDYTIENPKGSTRSGKDANGKEWKVTMHDTYGYIRGKFGKDGDHLDMFINDKSDLDNWDGDVFVVDQVNPDGSFDEHKVMYGYDSMDDAEKAYLANYSKGWQGLGNIAGASKAEFDKWLDTSNRKIKPFADYAKVKFSQAQSVNNDEPKTFEEFLNHPSLKFSIKNEHQRKAAEDAYEYASKLRPNKYAQYALVDMSNPSNSPQYYEKRVLADRWRRFYNKAVHNELDDVYKDAWGNYILFDLDRPFADQVNEVKGDVPNEFNAPDVVANKNSDNESGAEYHEYKQDEPSSITYKDRYKAFKQREANREKTAELRKELKEVEDVYKSKSEERVEYNKQLMKEYMDEHGLSSENDIPYDVWDNLRSKSFDKYQDELDSLFNKYKDLDKQIKAVAEPRFSLKDEKIKSIAEKFGVNDDDVAMYANAVERGSTADAARARANIKRYLLQANEDKISSFKDIIKYTKPINEALKENFGDLDAMIEERRKQVEAERNAMESARKRAQEEEEKRQKHLDELSLIPTDELDKRYMDAIANNDESTAREMLDESARRNGYGDADSDYQGQGAWAAPSNPQYESDEARRADIENSPDVNLEDISLGYNLQPDDYFDNPRAYMNNTDYGLESAHVIKNALDAIKNGEKDVKVKVYRAVPTSVKEGKLRNGDWVTPSKKYAEMHGDNRLEGKYRIIEDEVPANQLWWDGNDANEFGFDDGKEYRYKNAKNNRKLNDLITYDNNGNVIPPSKRFNSRKNDIRFSLKSMMEKPEGWKQANKKAIHIAEAIERDPKFSLKNLDGTLIKAGTYFSGGGLVEEGLKGIIDPVVAVEYDEKISGVYRNNFGQHIVTADVRDVDPKELVKQIDGEVEYFHASPVCKNYSQAKSNHAELEIDKETAASTAEFINAIKPKVVTIENVKGYKDSEAMKTITDALDANGYTWDADVYNAADYGGYTNRERLIVRAVRDGKLPAKPKKMAHKSGWYEAVDDIIPTLTEKKNGVAPWMDIRLKADGIDWRNIDKPLYVMGSAYADGKIPHAFADELLPTLRTKSGDVIVMPDGKVYRAMGRVLARVSGVSDDYKMPFSENLSHTIIGNGIPTQLTEHVIAPLLTGSDPKFSIRTYHGTGASFDKFDLSHALEGEGSETFGHGVYVTNSSKIGREYAQRAKQRKMYDLYKNMRYPDGVKGDIFKRRVFGEMVNDVATGGSVESAKEFAKKRIGADANDIQRTIENLKDREKGTEYEQNLKDRLAEYKESLKWIDSLDEDYLTQGNANRYDVDIPDDNGSNYLDWEGTILDSLDKQKVAEDAYKVVSDNQGFKDSKVTTLNDFIAHTLKNYVDTTDVSASVDKLKSDIKDVIEDDLADNDVLSLNEYLKNATTDDVLATIWYNDLVRDIDNAETGEELYRKLSTYVGDNAASQILSDNGLVGIKYPAGLIHGGAKEGDYNYVIFDENNANIVGNTRFSLRYDKFEHDLNQWKKDNNLPKDAQRPTIPQRNAGESAVDFLRRVDEYRKQMALWKTAPTYEQHLLSDDTALGEFNRELQSGSVLKRIAFQDSMLAIRKAQEAIMKEVGVDRLNMAEDAYTAENRSHGKGKNEFEEYNNEFLQPLRKAYHQMKKVLGDSYDNVRIYMMAKHGLERDAQMAFKKSLDADYEDVAQRSAAYKAYKGDINRMGNDSGFELGYIDFNTWRQKDDALRSKYSPSYMNYRYDKDGTAYDYSGLSALFGGSDFEEAASKLVRDIESSHVVEVQDLWNATNAATKKILRDGYKAGMMSKDTYQYVRDMYSHYIPLRGWDGTTADQVWDYIGGGKGAFNQTLKTAHGRTSIADDPIAYIENMAESGILLNNKNWVKQHLMLLAQNHPTSLLTLSKAWYVKSVDANGNEEWIPATPQITSQMNSNQVKAAIDAFEQKMEQMAQTGDATQKRDGLNIAYPQTHSEEREHEVRVMKDGEEYVIYVNGDPQLAQAMNNTRAHRVREIQSGKLDRAAAWLGRKMAAAYTSLSPLFIPSNYFRDLTMTLASTAIREDAKYNYLLRKNLATSWNLGFILKDFQNGKLREKVNNGNATPKEQMFYDFMMNGGETGFVSSLDVEDLKKKFKNDLKDLDRWKANPVKVGHTIMDSIEFLNRAIEDSNRFAVYMTSIQYGRSIDEAVNDAKDVTLNFNRKGTGEYGWQMIRNLYLFINPAVQSLQTLGALAKHHPFKFTAVTASWLASGVMVPIVNAALMSLLGGDDDKDKYWQFSKWDRRNNLIMWVPTTNEFVKIPLAQEFRAFYGLGDMIASKMMGGELAEESWSQYAEDLLGQVVDMLPLDPTGYDGNIAVSLMPNAIRPVFELAFNVDFTGKPLFKDTEYNKYDPNFTKAYVGTPDWLVRASKMVNSIGNDYPDVQQNSIDAFGDPRYNLNNPAVVDHVLSSYLGGAYTMGSQVLGLLTKSLNDPKEIKVADIPLFSKFVSNPDDRPVTKKQGDEFWNMKENHDRAANTLSKLKKQAKVDGDYSMLERFYGSEGYKQYKQDDVKVKKYEEDKKKERAEESGEEYRPHKLNAEDIYKAHATPKDDFEDLKLEQLYTKLNGFKSTYDLLVDTAPSQSDGYYNTNKAAIDAIDEISLDKQEISELKKGFLDDGKDAYNAEDMKQIRELRKKILAVLEKANKVVVANQKENAKKK